MEIPASARGAESSCTLAPDLSDREGKQIYESDSERIH